MTSEGRPAALSPARTRRARTRLSWAGVKTPSAAALVLANLAPLYGVLFLGWQIYPILLLFWCENVVIGVFNVLRMAVSRPPESGIPMPKVLLIPFFIVHYGMFTYVHGLFVMALFSGARGDRAFPLPGDFLDALRTNGLLLPVGLLAASHGVSFVRNFLGRREFERTGLARLMFQPYGRVVVLHLTLILGAMAAALLGGPAWLLAVLVLLKIGLDLAAHLREHADPDR